VYRLPLTLEQRTWIICRRLVAVVARAYVDRKDLYEVLRVEFVGSGIAVWLRNASALGRAMAVDAGRGGSDVV
jgi:hypothetical protein